MNPQEIDRLLALDPAWQAELRAQWRRLMEIAVWGELHSAQAGVLTRVRRRVLDLGERWRSLFNPRDWIPQPRERLKNALGSALAVRDSLALLEQAALDIRGGADWAEWQALLASQQQAVAGPLQERQNRWAAALDALNRANREV